MKTDKYELMMGDTLERMKEIPDGTVDMVMCDLPYATTRNSWDCMIDLPSLWAEYWRITKHDAAVVLTAQCPFDKVLGASQLKYLRYEWLWEKPKATGHLNAKKQPMKAHENILVFYRKLGIFNPQMIPGEAYTPSGGGSKKDNYGDFAAVRENDGSLRYPRSIQKFSAESGSHPTQKPVALMEYLIKTYTNSGELVLDNTAGSFTTGVACVRADRRFIGIERDETYYQIGVKRVVAAYLERLAQPSCGKIDRGILDWSVDWPFANLENPCKELCDALEWNFL